MEIVIALGVLVGVFVLTGLVGRKLGLGDRSAGRRQSTDAGVDREFTRSQPYRNDSNFSG